MTLSIYECRRNTACFQDSALSIYSPMLMRDFASEIDVAAVTRLEPWSPADLVWRLKMSNSDEIQTLIMYAICNRRKALVCLHSPEPLFKAQSWYVSHSRGVQDDSRIVSAPATIHHPTCEAKNILSKWWRATSSLHSILGCSSCRSPSLSQWSCRWIQCDKYFRRKAILENMCFV